MASYLTAAQARDRLAAFGITHAPSAGALKSASRLLDSYGPFYGARYGANQALAFPRTYTAPGDAENAVPEAILDLVAFLAVKLDTEDEPAVASMSVQHLGSKTFARPKVSRLDRLIVSQWDAVSIYQRKTGVLA